VNEVRTICELVLDEPGPPLRDGTAALAIARRATARRNRLRAAGSGLAAAAVAGVLATPAVAGWQAAPAPDTTAAQLEPSATATTRPPSTPPTPPARPPSAHAAPAHGHAMAAVLKAAVPPGYTVTKVKGLSDDRKVYSRTLRLKPNESLLAAHTRVEIAAGGGKGQLMAVIMYNGDRYPEGDLCSPKLAGSSVDAALPCEVVTVNGVQIKVTREHDAERGEDVVAIRYLEGGYLMVSSAQGIARYQPDGNLPPDAVDTKPSEEEHRPPLAEPPLTAQQVAELAADPAMLP
jgi:hypothetical protein